MLPGVEFGNATFTIFVIVAIVIDLANVPTLSSCSSSHFRCGASTESISVVSGVAWRW